MSTTFKLLAVTAGTAGHDAAGNHDLDNDSNGTSITSGNGDGLRLKA